MREFGLNLRKRGVSLGLVPTMGYLHAGHLSLLKLIEGKCDTRAASIFVNPLQFGHGEDLDQYPRDEENDLRLLEEKGCDLVFIPDVSKMYPDGYQTYVEVDLMTRTLCGKYRPEHFRGVTSVVLRLFQLTGCTAAAFGLKDYQQAMVIQRMVDDLFLPVKLHFGETVREPDGLAMSSRNKYLNSAQRTEALKINQALQAAVRLTDVGEASVEVIRKNAEEVLTKGSNLTVQYIEFVDAYSLEDVEKIEGPTQMLIAVYSGKTRLIDNIRLRD